MEALVHPPSATRLIKNHSLSHSQHICTHHVFNSQFHVRNYTSIIYMVLRTVRSASFSGTWTHVAPRSEPAMCICSAQWSRDTSGGFQFYALVGWRWGGPHSLERERKGWHWLVLTLQWPCEGCSHGGGGRAISHCLTVQHYQCTVLAYICQTETLPHIHSDGRAPDNN